MPVAAPSTAGRRHQHTAVAWRHSRRLFWVAGCATLFACGERGQLTGTQQAPVALVAAGTSLDASIDPADSWAVADVVIESSATITADTGQFVDPVTMLPGRQSRSPGRRIPRYSRPASRGPGRRSQ